MRLVSVKYSIPKRGSLSYENEDHYFPYEAVIRRDHHSVAIADGASEGFLSRLWSKILTISYVNWDTSDVNMRQYIDFCIDIYEDQRVKYLQRRVERGKPLKWFEENLMTKGSFSTLLGLSFMDDDPSGGYWASYSVGDSCLFHFRDEIIDVFPDLDSEAFGNNPDLIASNPMYNKGVLDRVVTKTGEYQYGDIFYLMTDAIANWFIGRLEACERPWEVLDMYLDGDHGEFTDFLMNLRDDGELKNDDVTIARVTVLGD